MAQVLGTCACVGDPEKVPGSQFQNNLAIAITAILGVSQQMKDLAVSLSL